MSNEKQALSQIPEDQELNDTVKQIRCGSKHHKREINGRVGRLHRAEKRYRKNKTHTGKGTTLRSHRPG